MANKPWDDEQQALRQLLKELRLESGFTQDELALKLSKPQSYVSKYESGERRLDYIEVKLLCTELGLSISEFDTRISAKNTLTH